MVEQNSGRQRESRIENSREKRQEHPTTKAPGISSTSTFETVQNPCTFIAECREPLTWVRYPGGSLCHCNSSSIRILLNHTHISHQTVSTNALSMFHCVSCYVIVQNTTQPCKETIHSVSPQSVKSTQTPSSRIVHFSFFFGRSWLVCPHFFFLQLVARGGRRA